MSKTTATHRYKMPKNSKLEITFMILVTFVPWPILAFGFPQFNFTVVNMTIAMGVFGALTVLLWFVGHKRRSSSQLFAHMDSDRNYIQAWMSRPSKAWGNKLSVTSNTLSLSDIDSVSTEVTNGNRTLVFRVKNRSNSFYLPQRLAVQPEVKDFFEGYIATEDGEKMPNKTLVTKFVNGDEGIVEKNTSAAKKPATLSELLEQEKEILEKEKVELEAQILGLEKEKGEQ